jgi:transcription antitermination factor NusG
VRVICGPFADQLAVVEKMCGPDRVRVLLSIMNRKAPIELRRSALAAV